jgi:hypothetical protein
MSYIDIKSVVLICGCPDGKQKQFKFTLLDDSSDFNVSESTVS